MVEESGNAILGLPSQKIQMDASSWVWGAHLEENFAQGSLVQEGGDKVEGDSFISSNFRAISPVSPCLNVDRQCHGPGLSKQMEAQGASPF